MDYVFVALVTLMVLIGIWMIAIVIAEKRTKRKLLQTLTMVSESLKKVEQQRTNMP